MHTCCDCRSVVLKGAGPDKHCHVGACPRRDAHIPLLESLCMVPSCLQAVISETVACHASVLVVVDRDCLNDLIESRSRLWLAKMTAHL